MSSTIVVIASLCIHPGREVEFRQFETEAARIMKKYGGQVERVIRPIVSGAAAPLPHEIHVVTFPNREQFDAYRADPDLASFAALRHVAIARTEIIVGEEGEPYV
jgi:uncharacterized protein (DUF1330 family)